MEIVKSAIGHLKSGIAEAIRGICAQSPNDKCPIPDARFQDSQPNLE